MITIGSTIGNKGVIERVAFLDLFNFRYVIDEKLYTLNEIQEFLTPDKSLVNKRLLYLLENNSKIAFKFLEKKILDTRNLPLINKLNPVLESIWEEIVEKQSFDISTLERLTSYLEEFWFLYNN